MVVKEIPSKSKGTYCDVYMEFVKKDIFYKAVMIINRVTFSGQQRDIS